VGAAERNAEVILRSGQMVNNISKEEFNVLAYLHEHAEGYTDLFRVEPQIVAKALGVDMKTFNKDLSYLAAHGLIGVRTQEPDWEKASIAGLWLTGDGENFMRELENQPGIARKITMGTVNAIYDAGREIIVKLLAEFLTPRM
jgi:hypothetical protein